jgi:hypothetical protein
MIRFVSLAVGMTAYLAFGSARAQDCRAGEIRCGDNCRMLMDLRILTTKTQGSEAEFEFMGLRARLGDVKLQAIAPQVQELEAKLKLLIESYNKCTLSLEEYSKRRDVLLGYAHAVDGYNKTTRDLDNQKQALATALEDLAQLEKEKGAASVEFEKQRRATSARLDDLKQRVATAKAEFGKQLDMLRNEVDQNRVNDRQDLEEVDRHLANATAELKETVSSRFTEIDVTLEDQNKRITGLEHRVTVLEALAKGHWNMRGVLLNLELSGQVLGGDLAWDVGGGFELVGFGPKLFKRLAFALEGGWTNWRHDASYGQLPGQPFVALVQDNRFLHFDVVTRAYFAPMTWMQFYIGGGARLLLQEPHDWHPGFGALGTAGIAFYSWNTRVLVGFRYNPNWLERKQVDFSAFGPADVHYPGSWVQGMGLEVVFSLDPSDSSPPSEAEQQR